jgi:hypothetical protein
MDRGRLRQNWRGMPVVAMPPAIHAFRRRVKSTVTISTSMRNSNIVDPSRVSPDLPAHRADLYPENPSNWAEWEVPEKMVVPLPPSLAYEGNRLLRNDRLAWAIFYTEWAVLVLGRWVADAYHRGLLWRLPKRLLTGIQDLDLGDLLRLSYFPVKGVDAFLGLHGQIDWAGLRQALARVGAIPVEQISGNFSIGDRVGMPVQGNLQMDEDEEVVANGLLDNPLFLQKTPRRGIRLRLTAQPENPPQMVHYPPGEHMTALPAEKRTPHSGRPLSSFLSMMALRLLPIGAT